MKFRVSSNALAGLYGLFWNAVQITAAADQYHKIAAPSLTVDKITTVLGAASRGLSLVTLTVAGGGICPAWCVAGAAVSVNVTKGGVPLVFSSPIRSVSDDGKTISFAMNPLSANTLSEAFNAVALDAIAGAVVNTITLSLHCQKAMLSVSAGEPGNISIAPVADVNGANPPYQVTLVAGGAEYEITAPTSGKFDLADWWLKATAGAPKLNIRFL